MDLHFYATLDTINGIHQGYEMSVIAHPDYKPIGAITVSFSTKDYAVRQEEGSPLLYLIKKL